MEKSRRPYQVSVMTECVSGDRVNYNDRGKVKRLEDSPRGGRHRLEQPKR